MAHPAVKPGSMDIQGAGVIEQWRSAVSKNKDNLTNCMAWFLENNRSYSDTEKSNGRFPNKLIRLCSALYESATDPRSKAFLGAQNLIWDRYAGKLRTEHSHSFPQVEESMSVYAGRVDVPLPLESEQSNESQRRRDNPGDARPDRPGQVPAPPGSPSGTPAGSSGGPAGH
jgi:hypothetical protein